MPPRKSPPAQSHIVAHTVRIAAKIAIALASAVALLFGLGYSGNYAGQRVAGDARYLVPISEIQFEAPRYIDKPLLLSEVRLLAGLPERVSSVDPAMQEKLKVAFQRHPWIERVGAVTPLAEGGLSAELDFRIPALAIQIQGEAGLRAVDRSGVLLPVSAPTGALPRLVNTVVKTEIAAGRKHPDPDVVRAAELVCIHSAKDIERVRTGWRITKPDGVILHIASHE